MLWVDVSNLHMVVVMVTKTTLTLYTTVYNNVVSILTLLDLTERYDHLLKNNVIILVLLLQQVTSAKRTLKRDNV